MGIIAVVSHVCTCLPFGFVDAESVMFLLYCNLVSTSQLFQSDSSLVKWNNVGINFYSDVYDVKQ